MHHLSLTFAQCCDGVVVEKVVVKKWVRMEAVFMGMG
jgi:hypothetical protein